MKTKKIWSFNIGEWTEAYVFLKLLGVGRVYGADANQVRTDNVYMDILEIIRFQESSKMCYERKDGVVNGYEDNELFYFILAPELEEKADYLYQKIKEHKGATMEDLVIQEFMEKLRISSPKTARIPDEYQDLYGNKTDIIIKSTSSIDRTVSTEGFSIKSHMGSSATLFNCSMGSRMIYEVVGCTDEEMYRINACDSFVDKWERGNGNITLFDCAKLKKEGMIGYISRNPKLALRFVRAGSDVFESNVTLTDTLMLQILSNLLLVQAGYTGKAKSSSSVDLAEELVRLNPLQVRKPEYYYPAKIKQFHFDTFAGMTASREWDGRRRLTGGYLDVDKEGNILYYRAMSDDIFSNYLFQNVYFDRPDRGVNKDIAVAEAKVYLNEGRSLSAEEEAVMLYDSRRRKRAKKGDWGYVYRDPVAGKYLLAINFQTRFK